MHITQDQSNNTSTYPTMSLSFFIKLTLSSLLTAGVNSYASSPESPEAIADHLDAIPGFEADATVRVSMAQFGNDIDYQLHLTEQNLPSDPYYTNPYVIDWKIADSPSKAHGFSAYFAGNHYRFAGERLQEFHAQWDSIPFDPSLIGLNSEGVQRSVQFFNILPQAIARDIRKIVSDPAYSVSFTSDTIVGGEKVAAIKAVMTVNGTTACTQEYLFDIRSGLPLRIRTENNPGTVSEQSVEVRFIDPAVVTPSINEESLSQTYSDIFARYRSIATTLESLRGRHLPGFSLPTISGERYSRRAADRLRCPAIVVLVDADSCDAPELIRTVRSAADSAAQEVQIIWAFTDNVVDRVEPMTAPSRPDETTLMSARQLIRDCGASRLPAIMIVDEDATVRNVVAGVNNDLISDVIKKSIIKDQRNNN